MRKLIIILFLALLTDFAIGQNVRPRMFIGTGATPVNPWSHEYVLRTNPAFCGTENSNDYVLLVSVQNSVLNSTGMGGSVISPNGYDINFFSDSALTTLLSWEVEYYSGTTGTLVAWVHIPVLYYDQGSILYMAVGNAHITSFQGGAISNTWNTAYYKCVCHYPDGSSLSVDDATGQNSITNIGLQPTAGIADGGALGSGNSFAQMIYTDSFNFSEKDFSISLWFNFNSIPNDGCGDFCAGSMLMVQDCWGNNHNWDMYLLSASQIIFATNSATQRIRATGFTLDPNVWHYCTITGLFIGFQNTELKIYVDGVLYQDAFNVWVTNNTQANQLVGFGADALQPNCIGAAPALLIDGILDEAQICRRFIKSQSWITSEYNNITNAGNIGSAGFITYNNLY